MDEEAADGSGRERLEPADAFALLGDETRLGIVRTLAEWSTSDPPTFAGLRRAVGVDDPGRFNYHLDQLRGQFIVKDGDRYRTTYAGEKVYEALATGTFTERVPDREGETDHACPLCGTGMRVHYSDGHLSMHCSTHGEIVRVALPPRAAANREFDALLRLADLEARRMHRHIAEGVCSRCWATLPAPEFTASPPGENDGDDRAPDPADRPLLLRFDCPNCDTTFGSSIGLFLVLTAEATAFLVDHGIDAGERNLLELHALFDERAAELDWEGDTVVGATASVTLEGETLTASFDQRGRVVDTRREPAE